MLAFQSTRPRGARRGVSGRCDICCLISIHAPAWGATATRLTAQARFLFQSTRPRGARRAMHLMMRALRHFNPRARVGRDLLAQLDKEAEAYFNPRARVGRDSLLTCERSSIANFNPRARVGRDARSVPPAAASANFNPRARVGRDRQHSNRRRRTRYFNPRARVGRDQYPPTSVHAYDYFNPRARVGRDDRTYRCCLDGKYFNPRARVGRDFKRGRSRRRPSFQSTRPRGARQDAPQSSHDRDAISIHAPAWGATVPVYTGLITAVALYFSRTSFCPCCYRHFSPQSPLCDTGSHRDFAAILAKEMPATASEFLQLHNLILHRRAAFFLRIYFPSYKNAGCLFLGQSNLSTHAAGRRTVLHRERIQTRSSARAVRGARSISPLFSSVCGRQVFPY